MNSTAWPNLQYALLKDSIETVQLWTQIVGKIRLSKMPWLNHSWHVSLYVSACGLSTAAMPYNSGIFQLEFDFIKHQLHISSSNGQADNISLHQQSVASFYNELLQKLSRMGIDVSIYAKPNEVEPAIPFNEDFEHQTYDAKQMHLFYQALVKIVPIMEGFRARFSGKCSPVHFFWGGFDLAVTRFSGRPAPLHQGEIPNMPKAVMQEAYSHEVSSAGFWPGNKYFTEPAFYSYAYPAPALFAASSVLPSAAFYSNTLGEFILPYASVANSPNPEADLMTFLETTYQAAATTGLWDKEKFAFIYQ